MKKLSALFLLSFLFLICKGQDLTLRLEFVMDLRVALDGEMINVGTVPDGVRTIIPITGGTFEGPNIRGVVISGGADYQLHSTTTHLSQLNAIYSIRTDDEIDIFVQNQGVVADDYFFTTPKFQAPVDSKYAWLNQSTFVCRPVGYSDGIQLRVWRVCDANGLSKVEKKFTGVPTDVFDEVAHKGEVEEFTYDVERDGTVFKKHAQVYIPYGYNPKDKAQKYNVVYLMHGGGDNVTSFFSDPRSPLPLTRVLDHLIAEQKMDPVIVVCPTFYPDDTNIGANRMDDAIALTRDFNKELHQYLIPTVEKAYNTHYDGDITATRDHRAFGGFSMGSLCTWYQLAYGINDVKHYIPLSGDLWLFDNQGNKLSAQVAAAWLNDKIAQSPYSADFNIYGYTGTEDIAYQPELSLFEAISTHTPLIRVNGPDSNAYLIVKDGGKHYYGDINEYLYHALPLIWKK